MQPNRYMIYCCAGTGGLFLMSLFAKLMGVPVQPTLSDTEDLLNLCTQN
jgi:hypothetical protein